MMEDARCKLKSMQPEPEPNQANQAPKFDAEQYDNPAADSAEL